MSNGRKETLWERMMSYVICHVATYLYLHFDMNGRELQKYPLDFNESS